MKDFLHFPDRLRAQMRERGINNARLAKAIGVSHVAIGNFLGGQLPKSEHLYELARFFSVPMEHFLEAEGEGRRVVRQAAGAAAVALESHDATPAEKQRLFNALSEHLATLESSARGLRQVLNELGTGTGRGPAAAPRAPVSSAATAEETRLLGALSGAGPGPAPKSPRSRATAAPSAPSSAPSRAASTPTKGRPPAPKRAPTAPAT